MSLKNTAEEHRGWQQPHHLKEENAMIKEMFQSAIFATYEGKTVTAAFRNGTRATYTASMIDMLASDPGTEWIMDDETGELIYLDA